MNGKMNNNSLKESINGQQIYEEMFNIPGHQGNANQNDIEIPSYPSQNG
jgi:hypothetical protein